MKRGGAFINTASVNSGVPNPMLLAYATTKGAIQNFTTRSFPRQCRMRPRRMSADRRLSGVGQPAELAAAYVMLADPLSNYTSGTTIAVTGGKPFI
jgi:NAD(P)-dependent dehydrogenase (short-subunit alcohol dehydrogenase family)